MELNQLQAFLVVAKYEHMTRAAEEYRITQSAMSRLISRLEEELGVRLFDRDGKNIRLNAYGEAVREHAGRIFAELDSMETRLNDLRDKIGGQLRVATSFPNREPDRLHDAIRDFMFLYPEVRVRLRRMNPDEIRAAFEEREIDLAITVSSIQSETIAWEKLFEEKMGIILAARHPLAQRAELHVTDLKNERFLCNNSSSDVYDLTRSFCARAGFEPDIYYEGDSPELIAEAIKRGMGVSFIAGSSFLSGSRDGRTEEGVIYREISDAFCSRSCGLAYDMRGYTGRTVSTFLAFLRTRLLPEPAHNTQEQQ